MSDVQVFDGDGVSDAEREQQRLVKEFADAGQAMLTESIQRNVFKATLIIGSGGSGGSSGGNGGGGGGGGAGGGGWFTIITTEAPKEP